MLELPYSPACDRNEQPIGEQLAPLLFEGARVLEIGAGTGQHAVAFSHRFPHVTWMPVDRAESLDGLRARIELQAPANCLRPVAYDLFDEHPPVDAPVDLLLATNVIHIAPWSATARLFDLARHCLSARGHVVLYGPYRSNARPLEPSNEAFDASLRARDPAMGLRFDHEVDAVALARGFSLATDVAMPANNRLRTYIPTTS